MILGAAPSFFITKHVDRLHRSHRGDFVAFHTNSALAQWLPQTRRNTANHQDHELRLQQLNAKRCSANCASFCRLEILLR